MVLIFVNRNTARKEYIIKHIFKRILQLEFKICTDLSEFIAHSGAKLSYGKKPLGEEFFIWSHDLLDHTGIDDYEIDITSWHDLPIFFQAEIKSQIPFDLFAASFYLITRYEEYLPQVKDDLGRFSPIGSLAATHDFIKLPLVDLWMNRFSELLVDRFNITLSQKRNHINHLIIDTPSVFKYKLRGPLEFIASVFKQLSKFRLGDFILNIAVNLGFKKDPFDIYDRLVERYKRSGNYIKISYFFHLGNYNIVDNGVSYKHRKYQELIKHLADYFTVGVRFTSDASLEQIKKQSKRFENITNRPTRYSIAALGKITIPDHYKILVELEQVTDFSMGYPSQPGFRASTGSPFYFYDLDYEVQTPLLINPYALHYGSIEKFTFNGQKEIISQLKSQCAQINVPFTMMLCNDQFQYDKGNRINSIIKTLLHEI